MHLEASRSRGPDRAEPCDAHASVWTPGLSGPYLQPDCSTLRAGPSLHGLLVTRAVQTDRLWREQKVRKPHPTHGMKVMKTKGQGAALKPVTWAFQSDADRIREMDIFSFAAQLELAPQPGAPAGRPLWPSPDPTGTRDPNQRHPGISEMTRVPCADSPCADVHRYILGFFIPFSLENGGDT